MKTTRTRMLFVFTVAAVIISFFMHWDDMAKGARQGWRDGQNYGNSSSATR
jgi:hypothetical protein